MSWRHCEWMLMSAAILVAEGRYVAFCSLLCMRRTKGESEHGFGACRSAPSSCSTYCLFLFHLTCCDCCCCFYPVHECKYIGTDTETTTCLPSSQIKKGPKEKRDDNAVVYAHACVCVWGGLHCSRPEFMDLKHCIRPPLSTI